MRRTELVQGRLDGLAEVAEPFGERAGGAREAREAPLDELRQLRDRVRRRLATQRADRRKRVLVRNTK